MTRVAILVTLLLALGTAAAEGSFSIELDVFAMSVTFQGEQSVAQVAGWNVYAGSGVQVSPSGFERLEPYTFACQEADLGIVFGSLCIEGRFDMIGTAGSLYVFTDVSW